MLGSSADWPDAVWHPTVRPWARCSLRKAQAAVPAAWREATVRAAVATVNHTMTVGVVSAAAQQLAQEVYKVMLHQKLTSASATLLAAGLIGWGASAALVSLGQEAPKGATLRHGSRRPANGRYRRSAAETGLRRHGRHIPGSRSGARPRRQAGGRRRGLRAPLCRISGRNEIDPMAARQKGRVASTDADGRFQFELDKGASDVSYWRGVTGWHKAQIAVAAPGFAPAWVEAGDMVKRRRDGAAAGPGRRARPRACPGFARPASRRGGRTDPSDLGGQGRGRPRRHAGLGRGG